MSNHGSNQELRRIYREAVFWDWRLRDPDLPDSEFERFVEWHAVAEHRETLDAVAAIRKQSHQTSQRSGVSIPPAPQPSRSRPTLLVLALAAVVLLAVAIIRPEIGLEIGSSTQTLQTEASESASSFDEQSIVRMARHTELTLTVGKHERSSYLKRGRAFFHVAHDPARPFVVQTPEAVVTVLGTQFDVANDNGTSVITVLDGTVAVSPVHSKEVSPASMMRATIHLSAGERIRVSSHSWIRWRVDSTEELAWATIIEFPRMTPIDQAIEQFSQRSGFRLALENPAIARKAALSGPFQLDDPKGFAQHAANKAQATVLLYGPRSAVERVEPEGGQSREVRR